MLDKWLRAFAFDSGGGGSGTFGSSGWTQVELAEKLGLDRSYLADIERGNRNVSLVDLELIALGFDMTLSRLLTRF